MPAECAAATTRCDTAAPSAPRLQCSAARSAALASQRSARCALRAARTLADVSAALPRPPCVGAAVAWLPRTQRRERGRACPHRLCWGLSPLSLRSSRGPCDAVHRSAAAGLPSHRRSAVWGRNIPRCRQSALAPLTLRTHAQGGLDLRGYTSRYFLDPNQVLRAASGTGFSLSDAASICLDDCPALLPSLGGGKLTWVCKYPNSQGVQWVDPTVVPSLAVWCVRAQRRLCFAFASAHRAFCVRAGLARTTTTSTF